MGGGDGDERAEGRVCRLRGDGEGGGKVGEALKCVGLGVWDGCVILYILLYIIILL